MTFDMSRRTHGSGGGIMLVAGPCAIESERQTLDTVGELAKLPVDLVRGGIWKPRTRPGCFEGAGEPGLKWLAEAKRRTGLPFAVEVALPAHVEAALRHGADALWVGARTTVNPFAVQALADALRGSGVPVMVKNPICPELGLWLGALERFERAGTGPLAAIHRGFSLLDNGGYRYHPAWDIPLAFMERTDIPLFCDPSHISGRAELVLSVAREALGLGFCGLMIESHVRPDAALSDARQQLTPTALGNLLAACGLLPPIAPPMASIASPIASPILPSEPVAAQRKGGASAGTPASGCGMAGAK